MKKFLCLALALFAALPLAFGLDKAVTFRGFVPLDFPGTYTVDPTDEDIYPDSSNYSAKMGFGIGLEAMINVWQGLDLGLGAQFGFNRGVDFGNEDIDQAFRFLPIYGLFAYHFDMGTVNPYAIARVGYNIHRGNDDYKDPDGSGGQDEYEFTNGACFSVGAGADIKIKDFPVDIIAELNYAFNRGGFQDVDANLSYKRLQLCLGAAYSL
jgi:opacity protein-like surface antigen